MLDVIHHIDIVEQLISTRTENLNDWQWAKQLRFYLDRKSSRVNCYAAMCEAKFPYTFEYQGNAPKLVHTPLTDKCYLTLTQGMHMGYGGNPYGPAGTGMLNGIITRVNVFSRKDRVSEGAGECAGSTSSGV